MFGHDTNLTPPIYILRFAQSKSFYSPAEAKYLGVARVFIPVGLLQDDQGLHVAHHIWVDSKGAWEMIGDKGIQHPEGFGSGGGTGQ